MKNIILILFFFPFAAIGQKIKVNEYDKFLKQRRIETSAVTLKAGANVGMSVSFKSLGTNYIAILSGYGEAASTIGLDDQAIFLLDNDSTVIIKSTGVQVYEMGAPGKQNTFNHEYGVSIPALEAFSKHDIKSVRKYTFKGYVNMDIAPKNQDALKNLSSLFLSQLIKENIAYSLPTVSLDEIEKYVGDSISVCGKVFGGRYLQGINSKPTLLNMGAQYPNQLLTIVIYGSDRQNFEESPEDFYRDKEVCVTGKVELYNKKPQIVVRNKEQLVVKEATAKAF